MFAQPWVGDPLYVSPLYPTLCLMGIGAQATVSSLLPVQLELGSTGSSSSFPSLSSWFRNESGKLRDSWLDQRPFIPSSLRVRQASEPVVPSQPPHCYYSFPHPLGVQQNKEEPEHHGANAGTELPRLCSGKGDAAALDDTTQGLWINCVLLWGRSLGDRVRLKSSVRTSVTLEMSVWDKNYLNKLRHGTGVDGDCELRSTLSPKFSLSLQF